MGSIAGSLGRVSCRAPAAAGKALKAPPSRAGGKQRAQAFRHSKETSPKLVSVVVQKAGKEQAGRAPQRSGFDGQELVDTLLEKAGQLYAQAKGTWALVDDKLALLTVSGMTLLIFYLALAVVDSVEQVPLAGPAMELVGILATFPYVLKLYTPRDRVRLFSDISSLIGKLGF